jgi:signal transduction histidine kinase
VVELAPPEVLRAIRNLVDNAIRHTPDNGLVMVESGRDSGTGSAWVAVQDGCGGIPEADLGRVFDMGFRGDPARSPREGGGGLGLAVARGLIEAHRGTIDVRNEQQGCRFTVLLPLKASTLGSGPV